MMFSGGVKRLQGFFLVERQSNKKNFIGKTKHLIHILKDEISSAVI